MPQSWLRAQIPRRYQRPVTGQQRQRLASPRRRRYECPRSANRFAFRGFASRVRDQSADRFRAPRQIVTTALADRTRALHRVPSSIAKADFTGISQNWDPTRVGPYWGVWVQNWVQDSASHCRRRSALARPTKSETGGLDV